MLSRVSLVNWGCPPPQPPVFRTQLNTFFLRILLPPLPPNPLHPDSTSTQPTEKDGEQRFIHRSAVSVSPSAPRGPSELMKNNWWSPHSRCSPQWIQTRLCFSIAPSPLPSPPLPRSPQCARPRVPREKCSFVRRLSAVDGLRDAFQLRLNDSRLQCETLLKAKRIETWLSMWRIHFFVQLISIVFFTSTHALSQPRGFPSKRMTVIADSVLVYQASLCQSEVPTFVYRCKKKRKREWSSVRRRKKIH